MLKAVSSDAKMRKRGTEMGYRSDVAYTIRFVGADDTLAKQSFYTFLAEAKSKPETALCFEEDDEVFQVVEDAFTINFHVDAVKWYTQYEEVKCHEELIKLAMEYVDNGNDSIGYVLARIGEETDDIDWTYGGHGDSDWICVARQLVMDWK